MTNFHGENKRRSFFEGWYLKHQVGDRMVAVIPAFHLDEKGKPSASVQVITERGSHWLDYPVGSFKVHPDRFCVRVGGSTFSELGVRLALAGEGITLQGQVHYGPFTPVLYDMMGPFRWVPGMQCNHGVLSLAHSLRGSLEINGERMDFTGGMGYIEKDWGSSFPSHYLWTQCSWQEHGDCTVMVSIANIPVLGGSFTGCIGVVYYGGIEYRLATYHGVQLCKVAPGEVILMQGELQLHIKLLEESPHPLKAPNRGGMTRTIRESGRCRVSYRFTVASKQLFSITDDHASFEQEGYS